MIRIKTGLRFTALLFVCSLWLLTFTSANADQWTDTEPKISLTHIFYGEVNAKGRATGYHHRANGKDTQTARLKKILSLPNHFGVYTALIEVKDPATGRWKEKFSSLFPDHFTRQQIIDLIVKTYRTHPPKTRRKWGGMTDYGFRVEGYTLKDGRIITAYPIFEKDL